MINEEIIQLRTGKTIQEYFTQLINIIEKNVSDNTILEGLGELLTDQQKTVCEALSQEIYYLISRVGCLLSTYA